jgi:hypothetical protein
VKRSVMLASALSVAMAFAGPVLAAGGSSGGSEGTGGSVTGASGTANGTLTGQPANGSVGHTPKTTGNGSIAQAQPRTKPLSTHAPVAGSAVPPANGGAGGAGNGNSGSGSSAK